MRDRRHYSKSGNICQQFANPASLIHPLFRFRTYEIFSDDCEFLSPFELEKTPYDLKKALATSLFWMYFYTGINKHLKRSEKWTTSQEFFRIFT